MKVMLLLIIFFLLIWGISLARCEILTLLHGSEFDNKLCQENTMIDPIKYLKVLNYSDTQARIYCVSEGYSMGNILGFTKKDEKWKYKKWNTVWSTSGTADNIVWPYWWHFFYSHKLSKDKGRDSNTINMENNSSANDESAQGTNDILSKSFSLDNIRKLILEADTLENKLYEGDIYSSSRIIGSKNGTKVIEYISEYNTFINIKKLFGDYYSDKAIEKILLENGFINLYGTIGIIAADGNLIIG